MERLLQGGRDGHEEVQTWLAAQCQDDKIDWPFLMIFGSEVHY